MAEAVELKQPGVEVLQVFQTENPTIVVPTLMPCIIGVCNQVVEVLVDNGSGGFALNTDARALAPAYAKCNEGPYAAGDFTGRSIIFSINNGPEFTITFPIAPVWAGDITAKQMADFLNNEFENANVYQDLYAEVDEDGLSLLIKTRAAGDQQLFTVRVPTVADRTVLYGDGVSTFGLGIPEGHTYRGFSSYTQRSATIPQWSFPDPRGNLEYLAIDLDTVRGFLYLGSGLNLQEGAKNTAFLRWGDRTAGFACDDIVVVDDGNGDPVSPIVAFHTELPAPLVGEDLTAASLPISVTGTADINTAGAALTGLTLALDGGKGQQSILFIEDIPAGGAAAFATWLTKVFTDLDFSVNGGGQLVITTQKNGVDAFIQVVSGTALTVLGFTAMALPVTGDSMAAAVAPVSALQPHPVKAGDLLYVDGVYKGKVLQVAPRYNGTNPEALGEVKLDKQYAITAVTEHFGKTFYFVAQNLPAAPALDRPDIDFTVDMNSGDVTFKHTLVRDTTGKWNMPMFLQTYLQYTALRKDVSVSAEKPALLRIDTTTMLQSLLSPINPSNPFAVGMYFALLNSSGAQISGIALDEKTDAEPYGTLEAYTRAFEFLESKEVYAIAPLTHDKTIGQVANAHAVTMSEPEYKGERVIIFCLAKPERSVDLLIASGECNRTASSEWADTGVANLASLLLANGVDASGEILAEEGVFLTIENDPNHYSIRRVQGSTVRIRYSGAEFEPGSNDDAFYYSTGTLPTTPWISFAFSVSIRGKELVLPDGNPDRDTIADTYQDLGKSFSSRRFWHLVLDKCHATFDGISQELEGFYMCSAYAGMIGGQPPQQSFTNFPIIGFTKVTGTNDFFSMRQMNRIAYGGNTIIVQEPEDSGPIFPRMALTTDMTSIETRTDSITKCLDFTAKFLRKGLRIFIGRFNITQAYLDTLSHVVQGLLQFLTGTFVLVDAEINNLVQDENNPDTVLLDITVDPPYPCNYIQIRLIV